jgi:serine/threonine protein kinase
LRNSNCLLPKGKVVKNECSILELCLHPHIVIFMKKLESKTSLYLVTELMKEDDLADYIKKKEFF